MRQLFQDPKAGTIEVVEVPPPAVRPKSILVRNAFSAVSPGTERGTVAAARDSYLRTARARPDLVRRVLDTVKREGILAAYRKVQAKLSEPQALGYSSAGVVAQVGPGAGDHFRVGDRVACCGGGVASHAEVICVPINLAARVPDAVPLEDAAFTTLGAISLHGVRTLGPELGGRYAVIGLGILGQLTVQLLRAHGARVAAYDLDRALVARSRELGAEAGLAGETDDQVQSALAWTDALGVDGVIVAAASTSDAPMTAAAAMCRDRGRVVALGFVPFGLPREIAYAKELELRISRSYGPGRYDPRFEESGLDYPPGYVRWTETRNLEAFLQALAEGRVIVGPLVTDRYDLEDAPKAYDALMDRGRRRPLGILIRYPSDEPARVGREVRRDPAPAPRAGARPKIGVAFIGAGAFARSVLLPRFSRRDDARLVRVVTARGLSAFDAQKKFGFETGGTDPAAVWGDPDVDLVCVTTRHDTHAELVIAALRADKNVFVEKPLALTDAELDAIENAVSASRRILAVGFNRRFSPLAAAVRSAIRDRGPIVATCRVNAGALPPGHWLNDLGTGGGRIVGEGCHFVDLLSFLAGDPGIASVQALGAGRPGGASENVVAQIAFRDGSVGQINYIAIGSPALAKERIEVHCGGVSAVIDDWASAVTYSGRRRKKIAGRGKGHDEEIAALIAAVRNGGPAPVPFETVAEVSRATLRLRDAVSQG